jgi:hypothetical protein
VWWSSPVLLGEEVDMVEFGLVAAEAVVIVVVDIAAAVVDIVEELLLEVAETTLGKID